MAASLLHAGRIERLNWTLSAGAVAAGWAAVSPSFATSVALGAALEAVNFRALRNASLHLFTGELPGSPAWMGVFALRFVLLGGAIWLATRAGADLVGLVVGLSLIVPASLVAAWRARPAVDPTAPALAPDDPSWDRWNVWLAQERVPGDEDEEEDEAAR